MLAAVALLAPLGAQAPARIATTAGALVASPFFFHGKQVVVRQPLSQTDPPQLAGTARPVFVFWRERPTRSDGEIRGEFWDIGRFEEGDPRLAGHDFRPILEVASRGQWPPRERVFVILGATMLESPLPQAPTLRAIALAPDAFEGRRVTLVGRFRGRNLYGDLPTALGKSKWDFVLQSADAAVWVSDLRPRGKGFELDPGARVDTGRWVQVTGTVKREAETVWIEGESVALSDAPEETPIEIARPVVPKEPPPTVIFSAPVQEDIEFDRTAPVRLQFSRDMDGDTFRNAVRVSYVNPGGQGATPPPPELAITYLPGRRALEIAFKEPLLRYQMVRVELLEGITAVDGQPLEPWVLTFTTGG